MENLLILLNVLINGMMDLCLKVGLRKIIMGMD